MTINDELPQGVCQTIGATKSTLMVFFNAKKFVMVGLLPQNTASTAVYFVNHAILPLANQRAQQLGISFLASCICISTIPCAKLFGMSKNRWPAIGASMFPTSVFTRLGDRRLPPV
jgi:hypothetical protein